MMMPGRSYSAATGYRYGFNGKENDNEVRGDGNEQDYGMRVYDTRLGRFLSADPLTKHYPWYTPYQFAGNKPIWATDIDGLEENTPSTYTKKPVIAPSTFNGVISVTDATSQNVHKTFVGNYAQLRKADPTRFGPAIVNELVGTNYGNKDSKLDLKITGTRSEISKTWKGTDMKYYTQYSYSFTNNNVTETGTFEVNNATAPVSARAWDPLTFLC
jgi:RHS repeat-associated protein